MTFDNEFVGYPVFITDINEDLVQIEILTFPSEKFQVSVKEAGDHLYWVAEGLRGSPQKPYTLTANGKSVTLDYNTASKLYFALKEWSEQFYDEIADFINEELAKLQKSNLN